MFSHAKLTKAVVDLPRIVWQAVVDLPRGVWQAVVDLLMLSAKQFGQTVINEGLHNCILDLRSNVITGKQLGAVIH
jgi:hypothetical protein